MNIAKLNYHNLKYHLLFNIALSELYKQGFSDINFYELVDYDMKPQPLKDEELNRINILRILAYKYIDNLPFKGLCTIMTTILIKDLQGLLERETACITIGKIECKKNGNLFNVSNKKKFLNKIKKQLLDDKILKLGGDIHAWITLCDGTIIDPTIDVTLDNIDANGVVCGSPEKIYKNHGYKYSPYMIIDYTSTDINVYRELDQIQKLEYARNNIIDIIELLDTNKNKEGIYFS